MARARDEAGNIWDVTDPNNPVLVQPAQQQQGGGVFRDPYRASAENRAQQDQGFEAARLQMERDRLALAQQQGNLETQRRLLDLESARDERQIEAVEREENVVARSAADVRNELKNDNILNEINRARSLISNFSAGNLFGTEFWRGVPGLGQGATNLSGPLDTITANLSFDRLSEMRSDPGNKTGGALGAVSERELALLGAAVSSLKQTTSPDELRRSLAIIERHYRNVQALRNGEDPRIPEVAERYGVASGVEDDGPSDMGGSLTSEGRWEEDPALRGVNSTVRDMIRRGSSVDDIRGYLNAVQPGLGDRTQDLERAVSAVRQNPEQEVNVNLENQWVPNSGLTQAFGDVGMSAPGAALIGAADTASLGFLDNLTGNPEMTRAIMSGVQEESPTAYLLGQIGGGVTTGLGIEGLLARGGMTGVGGMRAGDAIFGAGYGAGVADDPEESRVASALLGGGAGVAGGMAGRALGRGAGRAIAGVQDAAQRRLYDAGVRMTPGQVLGGAAKSTEDRLAGLPVVGDAIQARRAEGIEDFNRAAFGEAVAPIGREVAETGPLGIEAARAARSAAYDDALSGVTLQADNQFTDEIAALLANSGNLPASVGDAARDTLRLRVGEALGDTGELTGRDYQQVLRGLRRDTRSMENQPFGWDFGEVARGAEGALTGMAERQAPGVAEALANANRANMNVETLRSAVDAARNRNEELFMPSQLATAASQSARRFGNNQGTTNQPFYQISRAGQEVLPSKIPDSGTAGRMLLPLLAGGALGGGTYANAEGEMMERAGTGLTGAAVGAAIAAAPYSRTARDIILEALMRERSDLARITGERIYRGSDMAGLLAAPAAAGYVTQ